MKKLIYISFLLLVITACSESDDKGEPQEIKLSCSIDTTLSVTTRTAGDELLPTNKKVYVWAQYYDNNNVYLNAWNLTTQSSGALSGSRQIYPTNGKHLNFYGLYNITGTYTEGTANQSNGTALPASLPKTVATTQNTDDVVNSQDLLYASVTNWYAALGTANLGFEHKMSRVIVELVELNEAPADKIASIKLNNVLPTATVALPAGTVTASGNPISINMGKRTKTVGNVSVPYGECIIPPQTIAANSGIISVTLTNDGKYVSHVLTFNPSFAVTFQPGMTTRFRLAVDHAKILGYTMAIAEWVDIPIFEVSKFVAVKLGPNGEVIDYESVPLDEEWEYGNEWD